jgi:hypothetical protein
MYPCEFPYKNSLKGMAGASIEITYMGKFTGGRVEIFLVIPLLS